MIPTAPQKKQTRLTLSEQAKTAHRFGWGAPTAHLKQTCKISRRTATNIKKNPERIFTFDDNEARSLKTKTVSHTHFPLIEKKVYHLELSARSLKYPNTQVLINRRALLVRERLLQTQIVKENIKKVSLIIASQG